MAGTLYINVWMLFSNHGLAYHMDHGTFGSKLKWLFIELFALSFGIITTTVPLLLFRKEKE